MENSNNSYIFDVDKINSLVFKDFEERTKDVEILDEYDFDAEGKPHQVKKQIKETKFSDFSGQSTRYDLIKDLITMLDTVELDENGNPIGMTLGQVIALNTLDAYGLITKN